MSALARIQKDFSRSIRTRTQQDFLYHIKATNQSRRPLLDIYHNTVYSTHIRLLEQRYTLVFSCMGITSARLMAQAYVKDNFPQKGMLEGWGGDFASFIQNYDLASTWPYLSDIARYEWAWHLANGAPKGFLLPEEAKQLITSSQQKEVTFEFDLCCCLLAFQYPLDKIISALDKKKHPSDVPAAGTEFSYVFIFKDSGIVKVQWLSPSLFIFLNRLQEGQDSDVAFASAQVLEAGFDAARALEFLIRHPVLKNVNLV